MESNIVSLLKGTGQQIAIVAPTKSGRSKKTGYLIFESLEPVQSTPIAQAYKLKFSAKGLPRMDKMGLGKSGKYIYNFIV